MLEKLTTFRGAVKNETQKGSANMEHGTSPHLWVLKKPDKDNFMHGEWGKVSVIFSKSYFLNE